MSDALRIAVLSDVHGNLQALDAVLREIDRGGPWDQLIVAGDHCLNGPDPAAAFDRVRERASAVLKGNTDRDIVDGGASDPDIGEKKRASIAWTREQLGAERLGALDALAFDARVVAPDGSALLVVHANPRDLDRHIFPDMPDAELRALLGPTDARVLAYGHLHIPGTRRLGDLRLFNVAACGLPRDGDRRAVWGAFSWSPAVGWRGTLHRTAYDVGDTVLRMLESGMPHPERRIRDLLRARYD